MVSDSTSMASAVWLPRSRLVQADDDSSGGTLDPVGPGETNRDLFVVSEQSERGRSALVSCDHAVNPDNIPKLVEEYAMPSTKINGLHLVKQQGGRSVLEKDPKSEPLVPQAWTDFLTRTSVPLPQPEDDQNPSTSITQESQTVFERVRSASIAIPLATDSGLKQSTAVPTIASSFVANISGLTPSSADFRSRRSRKSSRMARTSLPPNQGRSSYCMESQLCTTSTRPMGSIFHLEAPTPLLLLEKFMFSARAFIASSQPTDPSLFDKECGKLEQWFNDFNPALLFLRDHKLKKAFRFLKRCFADTRPIIELQSPWIVIYVCQQAIRCIYYDTLGRNLSQTLLKYVTGLCQALFGTEHHLYIIFDQLTRMDSFAQNVWAFMDYYCDHLEPYLEQSNNAFGHLIEMRGMTTSLTEGIGIMGIEAKPILDGLVRKAQAHGLPSLHLRVETAAILQRNCLFDEALSLLSELRESQEAQVNPYEFVYTGIILISTLQKMEDRDGAIRAGYEVVDFLSKPLTGHSKLLEYSALSLRQYLESRQSCLMSALVKLEKGLRDAGRIEEADVVQARLDCDVAQEYGAEDVEGD